MKRSFFFLFVLAICLQLFGQSTEPLRIIHGPWLQHLTGKEVTVCFTTNLPAVPGVLLGDGGSPADSLIRNSTDGLVNVGMSIHKVRISELKPGNRYVYRICAVEILKHRPYQVYFGDTLRGKEFQFTTADQNASTFSCQIVNDIHTNGGRLGSFLSSGRAFEKDLVIFNGDMVDNFETVDQLLGPILDTSVRHFATGVPFLFVRGNHETRGILSRTLKEYLAFPEDRYYYSIDYGPVHLVVLDCGEDKPDSNRYYYGLADFDNYRLKQAEWLKEHVKTEPYLKAPFRVVVIHMPLQAGDKAGYGPAFLYEHFGPILREAGADLMISAHTHRTQWLDPASSGLGFPVLINGNNSFINLSADTKSISLQVITDKGEVSVDRKVVRK
jgi:acid phosphatase type 7